MTTHRQDHDASERGDPTSAGRLRTDGGETEPVDGPAGQGAGEQFPRPPMTFTDDEGREIEVRVYDDGIDPLAEMYDHFDPDDRSQGIPPRTDSRIQSWLETLLEDGLTVVAWHGDQAVGHSVLVPMEGTKYELAIFVRSDYQLAGIGGRLIRCLLGHGQAQGVETVWLTVQNHNNVAINLYETTGFEQLSGGQEWEMEREI